MKLLTLTLQKMVPLACLTFFGLFNTASAQTPIRLDGAYYSFYFEMLGGSAERSILSLDGLRDSSGDPFVFAVPAGFQANFSVIDLGRSGDRFEMFDNGLTIGQTSQPTLLGTGGSSLDYVLRNLNDPDYSQGTFQFGPGAHSVALTVTQFPWEPGFGAVSGSLTPIPEPCTGTLVTFAAFLLFQLRKRLNV